MTTKYSFLGLLLQSTFSMLLLILISCGLFVACNHKVDAPTYIEINEFKVDEQDENLSSIAISDVWLNIDTKNTGTYQMPAKIPVHKSGELAVKIHAGVILYDQLGIREKHPFLESYDTNIVVSQAGNIHTIYPVLRYKPSTQFIFTENFEQATQKLRVLYGNKDSAVDFRTDALARNGTFSGKFTNNAIRNLKITLKDSLAFSASDSIYIELDFINGSEIELGLEVWENNTWKNYPVLLNIPKRLIWKKIYLNPMPYLLENRSSGHFRFFIKMDAHTEAANLWLDNLIIMKRP